MWPGCAAPAAWRDDARMLHLQRGEPVVLRNVVRVEPETGPVRITRKNQDRVVTVSANITGRDMGSSTIGGHIGIDCEW